MFGEVLPSSGGSSKTLHLNTWLKNPKSIDLNNDVRIYRDVYLRTDGTNAQLAKLKTDGTVSVINIHANIAPYISSFVVDCVHPVTANEFVIEYHWKTSDVVYSIPYFRIIYWKYDGTLAQGGEYQAGVATNATTICYRKLTKSLFSGNIQKRYITLTIASNNKALSCQNSSTGWLSGSVSFQDNFVSVSSAANTYMPPFDRCVSKGGVFYYTGSNNYFAWDAGYYLGYRSRPLSEQDSDVQALGVTDHYVLGHSTDGFFITVQFVNGYANVYVFTLDVNATNGKTLVLLNDYNIGFNAGNNNVIGFENDTFILDNGQRFMLGFDSSTQRFKVDEISNLDITHASEDPYTYSNQMFLPDSDLWEGVLIY